MPNKRLTTTELQQAARILARVKAALSRAAAGDSDLAWALRRKVYKELIHDERGKPAHRRKLKATKRREHQGICPLCGDPLPDSYVILDRIEAMEGYTPANTRLIHQHCDIGVQRERGYR